MRANGSNTAAAPLGRAPDAWVPVDQSLATERSVTLKLGRLQPGSGIVLVLGLSGQVAELMGWKAGTVLGMQLRRLADGGRQLRFHAAPHGRALVGVGRGGIGLRAVFAPGEDLARFEAAKEAATWVTDQGEALIVTVPWNLDAVPEGD
jgi:hypothetical protein